MGLTNVKRMLVAIAPPTRRPAVAGASHVPPPAPATILRHCRCADCLNFWQVGGEYFCSEYIGGMSVVWATGQRFCDPPPDAWHYCARYRGPQVSRDVWVWPKRGRNGPRRAGGDPTAGRTITDRPGGNRSTHDITAPAPDVKALSGSTSAARSHQVGAGSNISAESGRDAALSAGTDTGEPVRRRYI